MLNSFPLFAPPCFPMYSGDASGVWLNCGSKFTFERVFPLTLMPSENGGWTDQQIIQQIRDQRPEALSCIYDRYSTLVFSIAMRVLRDPAAAEDVMQEVFLKLWQQPDAYAERRGSLCGWLAVVTRNRAIDRIRANRPMENVDDLQLSNRVELSTEAEREILLKRVREILGTMPADQRLTMEMAYFEGQTHSEIAERMGQPLGTVKTRIRSALISLRKAFDTTE